MDEAMDIIQDVLASLPATDEEVKTFLTNEAPL
jgi:hypothetical protein